MPTPTSGLFETHLTVADLARSTAFYRAIVGLEVAHEMPERQAVFLWIGGAGVMPRDGGGGREIDEPVVYPWMPAARVDFDDPDGHSLEYLAMIDEAPRPDLPRMTLSAWRAR